MDCDRLLHESRSPFTKSWSGSRFWLFRSRPSLAAVARCVALIVDRRALRALVDGLDLRRSLRFDPFVATLTVVCTDLCGPHATSSFAGINSPVSISLIGPLRHLAYRFRSVCLILSDGLEASPSPAGTFQTAGADPVGHGLDLGRCRSAHPSSLPVRSVTLSIGPHAVQRNDSVMISVVMLVPAPLCDR
jgi:hypothetical protein